MPKQAAKRLYLAGPMTGYPQFNFPAFYEAASKLREQGYEIVSPAELDGPEITKVALKSTTGKLDANGKIAEQTWGDLLGRDVKIVADTVQGIVFLPGWERSKGARLEAYVGLLCKHEFYRYTGDGRAELLRPYDDVLCPLFAHTDSEYDRP
jgi:Domain of unknown function (DUF4406)